MGRNVSSIGRVQNKLFFITKNILMNFESQKEQKLFSQFEMTKKNGGIVGKNSLFKNMNEFSSWEYHIRTRISCYGTMKMVHKLWNIPINYPHKGFMGVLSRNGYLGQKLQNFYYINKIIVPKYFRNHAWGEPMWKVQSVHDLLQSQGND